MKSLKTLFIAALSAVTGACATGSDYANADVQTFKEVVAQPEVQVVDVRTPGEYAGGHLKGAINIDVSATGFEEAATAKLDKSKPVAVYCRSGARSARAAGRLTKLGYKVTNLKGGIMAWQGQGEPVE